MPYLLAILFFAVGLTPTPTLPPPNAPASHMAATGQLRLEVRNIAKVKGQLLISIYNEAAGFPQDPEKAFATRVHPVSSATEVVVIKDLPYGTYAVAVAHDADQNGELNTNVFGVPKEDWGVSNNVRYYLKPPAFDECQIVLQSPTLPVQINL